MEPFATKYRPEKIEEMVGQQHILHKNSIIQGFIKNQYIQSMILYGCPGTGKTTLARILSKELKKHFIQLNAVDLTVNDLREVINETDEEQILYIDEIHLLTKRIQQVLLESVENGNVILIGSTAENPYFTINKAILSRCIIFEFKELKQVDIVKRLNIIVEKIERDFNCKIEMDDNFIEELVMRTNGDLRNCLNKLEAFFFKNKNPFSNNVYLNTEDLNELSVNLSLDSQNDRYYDLASAFMKSLRGSATNASLHYLSLLLQGGNNALPVITRRLLCSACEDVGSANFDAIVVVKSLVDTAIQLGFPECRLPLAEAVVYLTLQPKSNSCYLAIEEAMKDVSVEEVPEHLKDSHYIGAKMMNHGNKYKYPHDYPNHYVNQEYMPEELKNKQYYHFGTSKIEKMYKDYWEKIKKEK